MYNYEDDYWDYEGGINASFYNWVQKSGSTHYVKPDSTSTSWGSYVIRLTSNHPHDLPITNGVVQATKPVAEGETTFSKAWVYSGKLRIYNDVVMTEPPTAIAGVSYGNRGCVIPTYEEWSAMTTEEQNTFKNTYFEPSSPTGTNKFGVPIDDYYVVKVCIGCIGRYGDYPTDANYPYYVSWGDITSTSAATEVKCSREYEPLSYAEYDIMLTEPFNVETDTLKAIVIKTQKQYRLYYWTGYNSSGNMTYNYSTYGRNPEVCGGLSYQIHMYDWDLTAGINNGYPYGTEWVNKPKDIAEAPYPSFFWTISSDLNNGYPTIADCYSPERIGAFANNHNLQRVEIPRSVSFIGEYAFAYSSMRAVTISEDCVHSDTSFPPRCVINYYVE